MAASALLFSGFTFFLLFNLVTLSPRSQVFAGQRVLFEDGYTVNTILDGDKLDVKINPYSILPQSGPSDFIILDSVASTFYIVSFSSSSSPQESVIKKLAGNGEAGYADGDLGSAMFKKPRSFAVDLKGNVYVADKGNHAIRKITGTGVTTIAGGFSQTAGRTDGPARNASFSDDFELVFAPERCALMISDHGNRLVRQINLKQEDCATASKSVLGTSAMWVLGLGLSCVVGLIVGFLLHPYIVSRTGRLQTSPSQHDMEAFPNQSGETSSDTLLRHQKRSC